MIETGEGDGENTTQPNKTNHPHNSAGQIGKIHLGLGETIQENENKDFPISANQILKTLKILVLPTECLCPPLNPYVEAPTLMWWPLEMGPLESNR